MLETKTKRHLLHLMSRPVPTIWGLNVPIAELLGCGAKRNQLPVHARLPQRPLDVRAIGLGALHCSFAQCCMSEVNEAPTLGL